MTNDTMRTTAHRHTPGCWWDAGNSRWMCPPDPALADRPLVDVRDMIVVHTAMLREFRLAPAAVRRTTDGDRPQSSAVAAHLDLLLTMLHHHHAGEDELLWPKLQQRIPAPALASLQDAEAQHEGIDAAITSTQELRASWAEEPTSTRADRLAVALEDLHRLLAQHLELEETELLPWAASVLTPAEWHEVGEHGAASLPKSAMPLVFGMFAYEGDPVVLKQMLQGAPGPVRLLVPRLAPRLYARHARRIHGTPRP